MPTSNMGTDRNWRASAYVDFDNTTENATTIIWHILQVISEFFISSVSIRSFSRGALLY